MRYRFLTLAILAQLFVAASVAASHPVYNVTGHWLGTSFSARDQTTSNLEATFTTTNSTNTHFSGTLSVSSHSGTKVFDVHGTVSSNGTFKANLTVSGAKATLAGRINAGANTIAGTYKSNQNGHTDHGTFTVTKS